MSDSVATTFDSVSSINKKKLRTQDSNFCSQVALNEKLKIVCLLNKAKFPVYLTFSPAENQYYALKIFEYQEEKPHPLFLNQARFNSLEHPSIIKTIHSEEKTVAFSKKQNKQVSCILIEYAPYGDFATFLQDCHESFSEKLIRTYFRQLIDGIEHLQSNNVWHLDLKLENLLIGKDYLLKISDFDLSYKPGDSRILTKGTRFYRAPELKSDNCKDGFAADIFSAGVILFMFRCSGFLPYIEDTSYQGVDLLQLINTNSKRFFKTHCKLQNRKNYFFSSSFKKLIIGMLKIDPKERMTIQDIRKSKWFNGPVYTKEDLVIPMKLLQNKSKHSSKLL